MRSPADPDSCRPDATAPPGGAQAPRGSPGTAGTAGAVPGAPTPVKLNEVPIVERRARPDRRAVERRVASVEVPAERRKGGDRRLQSERRDRGKRGGEYDLDDDTLEFIAAVNRFKEATGKTFPTWSDLLGIVRDLGYEKHNT